VKAISVMIKSLREQIRDYRGMALSIALPSAFMIIFGLAFGGGLPTIKVMLDDQDKGAAGQVFVKALESFKYSDGKAMVEVLPEPSASALDKVKAGDAAGYFTLPPGFTQRIQTGELTDASAFVAGGDPASVNFRMAFMFASDALAITVKELTGKGPPAEIKTHWIGEEGTKTEFDWSAPGLMVFAIMMLVAQTAMLIVAEVEGKTLQRLRLTAMTAKDLFLGVTGSQMVMAAFQVPLMFGVAKMLGYNSDGSLVFGMLMCIALSLCAVGCGLLTSCIARTPMEAANMGAGVLMPMVFLSGAMFPIPPVPLFTVGSQTIGLWDFLPPTHVVEALRQTLTYGVPWTQCTYQLVATLVLSIAYLVFGMLVFQRVRMKTEY
jgi:ABC-2 type transport system permease protein